MFDYIRISCCVPAISVADVAGNTEQIAAQMRQAAEQGAFGVRGVAGDGGINALR